MRLALLLLAGSILFPSEWPRTVPERTDHHRTSTVAEVEAFMEALARRDPALKPYRPAGAPTRAEGGGPLRAWRLAATSQDAVRVYLNGNIHAGEVEGKEALQQLVRELLQGKHPALRRHLDLVVVPAYNPDATDALDPAIRPWQPNPESGVGRRENARGLDLNRDLMKTEAASTRFFLAIARSFDPQVVVDLHTTNGSSHGFHLTYAPAAALGNDPTLQTFNRTLLSRVREGLKAEGVPTYDYGDFEPDEPGRRGGMPQRWGTVHPFPRYLVNYQALRHRLGILSECFVYRSYPERIETTLRFVKACLERIVQDRAAIRQEIAGAETRWRRLAANDRSFDLPLGFQPVATETHLFDVITPIRNANRQIIGEKARQTLDLPAFLTWKEKDLVTAPLGFLVDAIFADEVRPILERHGLKVLPGSARPRHGRVMHFHETGRELSKDAFQGVHPLTLRGAWQPEPQAKPHILPWRSEDLDRALWVPLDQPLGRLAFYLLDPRSPDGLVYWGAMQSALVRSRLMWGEPPRFPILALFGGTGPRPASDGPSEQAVRPEGKHE